MSNAYIQTFTGRRFYFDRVEENEMLIDDIAHALSLVNRFGGHTRKPYSVAQHSVLVSRLVEPQFKLHALFHDAHEAYLGDTVRSLKSICPQIKDLEHLVDEQIFAAFGIYATEESKSAVKLADNQMLSTEASQLLPTGCDWIPEWDLPSSLKLDIYPWDWKSAEQQFLGEYLWLTMKNGQANPALVTEGRV